MPVTESQLSVIVPKELLNWVEELMQGGQFSSHEMLLEHALRRGLSVMMKKMVDAEFREMANDEEYQAEARQLLAEFASCDNRVWDPE